MLRRLRFRTPCLAAVAALFVVSLSGQVPTAITAVKLRGLRQTSAVTIEPDDAAFAIQVDFASPPPASTTVQLHGPAGFITLARQPGGSFEIEQGYATVADLTRAVPDGTYTVSVSGGPERSTTRFTLTTDVSFGPLVITNYDALQSWPNAWPSVRWEPLSDRTPEDLLALDVYRSNGELVGNPSPFVTANAGVSTVLEAPFNENLDAVLMYLRLTASEVSGSTAVAAVSAFVLTFPIRCVTAAPIIRNHPRPQLGFIGGAARLTVDLESGAQALTYRLLKDGVVVSGITPSISSGYYHSATFEVPIRDLADAGTYTVVISNPSGNAVTNPAEVIVAPSFRLTPIADTRNAGVPAAQNNALDVPFGLAADPAGNVYVADSNNNIIVKVAANGETSILAGRTRWFGATNGIGDDARFFFPSAMALGPDGNLYVADTLNHVIRKVTPAGEASTYAGVPSQSGTSDGRADAAKFNRPQGLAFDRLGNLYVGDTGNGMIRVISQSGIVSRFAGRPRSPDVFDPTDPLVAPRALAFDAAGRLYVCDGSSALKRITPAGEITTVYGGSTRATPIAVDTGRGDGTSNAIVSVFAGVGVDPAGVIYVGGYNGVLRIVEGAAAVAMGFTREQAADATTPWISSPYAFVRAADGSFYLCDANRVYRASAHPGSTDPRIRIQSIPRSQTVAMGGSAAFSVNATGPGLAYQWFKDGVGIGGGTTSTLLLSPTNGADAGAYTVLVGNGAGAVGSARSVLTFVPGPDAGRLTNLSIRAPTGPGAQMLIVGLVLAGGNGSATKPLLVRGIGPTLANFGIRSVLADPALTLLSGTNTVAANDDWAGISSAAAASATVGAFALPPDSHDAVLVQSLAAGNYTAQITGRGGATGVALAEVYDLGATAGADTPRLVNVSSRVHVGTGTDVLIAGFVVNGTASKTLLIRGIGPTLRTFGVTGVLEDPRLDVYSSNTLIAGNDDWSGDASLSRAMRAVGAFPLYYSTSKDAALVVTLPPGAYTAQVSGINGAAGVALLEVYELP